MFRDRFSARAPAYAQHRPGYPAELAQWLASVSGERRRAWDAGCGSGQLSERLGDCFEEVVASDASVAQLSNARMHPRVRYLAATAEASALRAASVDLAVAAQAAHWFDLPRYWEEVRRVACPGATVAVVTYMGPVVAASIDERVERFYHDDAGPYWPPERRLVEAGLATLEFPFDELTAPAFALRERWTVERFIGYVDTWSAVQRLRQDRGDEPFDAFARELRALWGGEARDVTWPLAMRVGRVGAVAGQPGSRARGMQ